MDRVTQEAQGGLCVVAIVRMPQRRRKSPAVLPKVLAVIAVGVLVMTVAAPIVPGAGNSTGILMLSALSTLALASAPSRVGWFVVLLTLGIAAGAGA